MKKVTLLIMFIVVNQISGIAMADESFNDRCQGAGVMWCNGFDTEQEVVSYRSPGAGQNSTTPAWDTSVKSFGAGSLKFELRGNSGGNAAGDWRRQFPQDFAENSTFYLSYKLRYSPEMLGGSLFNSAIGMKQHILSHTAATCNNVEITMQHLFGRQGPSLYSRCGADQIRLYHEPFGDADYWQQWSANYSGSTGQFPDGTGFNRMSGSTTGPVACHYGDYSEPDCLHFKSNQWMTFYFEVHIGNWGAPNSSVKAWMGYEGQALRQFVDLRDHIFQTGGSATSYNMLTLHTYMSFKKADIAHPTGFAWYDEVYRINTTYLCDW